MKIASTRFVGILAALLGAMMVGCGDTDEHGSHDGHSPAAHEDAEPETEQAEDEQAEDDVAEDDDEGLDFEGLSVEDRKLAKAQKVCPVSDQTLGSMGTPIRIEHDGKVIFFCCQMCKPRFEADPEPYLAKLQKK